MQLLRLVTILCVLLLAACGQKGALILVNDGKDGKVKAEAQDHKDIKKPSKSLKSPIILPKEVKEEDSKP